MYVPVSSSELIFASQYLRANIFNKARVGSLEEHQPELTIASVMRTTSTISFTS